MCLRFVFLLATRLVAWSWLFRREESWKDAEILLLRHQRVALGWAGLVEVMDGDDMMPSDAQVQAAAEGRPTHPAEPHSDGTAGSLNWLRAGVLGANDGIVSVAGIVIGVAGATSARGPIFTAGLAGLVAGAASMALGDCARAPRGLGVDVDCFRPPAVPAGTARLRVTAGATLTDQDIDRYRAALTRVLACVSSR